MPSFIQRIFGKREDKGTPPGWAKWDGPWHLWSMGPRVTRVHEQQFVCEEPWAEHDRTRYVLRGMTSWHVLFVADHILISCELADVLARCCPDDIDVRPAQIADAPSGKNLGGYVELLPREQISREEILSLKPKGARVWRYQDGRSHLFVSRPVKLAIEQERISGLQFWPGLSAFFD